MAIRLKSMTVNAYSCGIRKAVVQRHSVMPDWASAQFATELMNCAFELYYRAVQNINATSDSDLQSSMTEILEDCGTTGWGSGVSDLNEAFEHLVEYDGTWYDRNSKNYSPVRYSFSFPSHRSFQPVGCTSAESCVNFLAAFEDVASGVLAQGEDLVQQMDRLRHALNANQWDAVSDACTAVNRGFAIGDMAGVAVLAAVTPDSPVPSLWETLDGIAGGIRNYEALRARDVSPESAEAIGVLSAVVALVPVLGWYFEKALEYCPALVDVVQGIARRREAIMAEIDRESGRATERGVHAQTR